MKEELEKYLFRDDSYTYAVLDGASVPDLPVRLHELDPVNICLYRGDLSDEMVYLAPYLVHLRPGGRFSDWLLAECWGKHWGIFVQSAASLTAMRKHFRELLTVHGPDGNPMLFRFYDPRALSPFLLTCDREQLQGMFGDIRYYFAESDDETQLFRFSLVGEKLKQAHVKLDLGGKA
jgi:hypothetical protein